MKYAGAATADLTAYATLAKAARDKLASDLERRGRALVSVAVELRDAGGNVASAGRFEWYVERGVVA